MESIIGKYLDYFLVPRACHRMFRESLLRTLDTLDNDTVQRRVNYYNRLSTPSRLTNAVSVGSYRFPLFKRQRFSNYFLDLYQSLCYFQPHLCFDYLFGDVIHVPAQPTFVKSRPIAGDVANSVVMKLDKHRHFCFLNDTIPFTQKRDMLVSRTTWAKASKARTLLNRMFLNHPFCEVGKTWYEPDEDFPESVKPFLTKQQQLEYKFIACIEGNDVASNLKWVMSSNSIAVMPRPCYETWYMEGTLKPDYHYIEVRSDFSDLIDKLHYYCDHPAEAQAIIDNAHAYVHQFLDLRQETALQVLVAKKYFDLTQP